MSQWTSHTTNWFPCHLGAVAKDLPREVLTTNHLLLLLQIEVRDGWQNVECASCGLPQLPIPEPYITRGWCMVKLLLRRDGWLPGCGKQPVSANSYRGYDQSPILPWPSDCALFYCHHSGCPSEHSRCGHCHQNETNVECNKHLHCQLGHCWHICLRVWFATVTLPSCDTDMDIWTNSVPCHPHDVWGSRVHQHPDLDSDSHWPVHPNCVPLEETHDSDSGHAASGCHRTSCHGSRFTHSYIFNLWKPPLPRIQCPYNYLPRKVAKCPTQANIHYCHSCGSILSASCSHPLLVCPHLQDTPQSHAETLQP